MRSAASTADRRAPGYLRDIHSQVPGCRHASLDRPARHHRDVAAHVARGLHRSTRGRPCHPGQAYSDLGRRIDRPVQRLAGDPSGSAPISCAAFTNSQNYAPGGRSRRHHHAGSIFAYVLSGAVRSENYATGSVKIYKAGESFFEPPGSTHLVSENASATEPASLLAVFIADDGAQLTTFESARSAPPADNDQG